MGRRALWGKTGGRERETWRGHCFSLRLKGRWFPGKRKLSWGEGAHSHTVRDAISWLGLFPVHLLHSCHTSCLAVCSPPAQTQSNWRLRAPQVPKANAKLVPISEGAVNPGWLKCSKAPSAPRGGCRATAWDPGVPLHMVTTVSAL